MNGQFESLITQCLNSDSEDFNYQDLTELCSTYIHMVGDIDKIRVFEATDPSESCHITLTAVIRNHQVR